MSDGIDIDKVHGSYSVELPAKGAMTTAEIVEAWHQYRARVLQAQTEQAVLTADERQVLTYIAKGFNGKEIAHLAGHSAKWVEAVAMKIRAKLDATTFECVTLAIRAEWV